MNAIETSYAGCRFRSRLEARWAVFFDQLGIEWEYEPEGVKVFDPFDRETPKWFYLPDFYLPTCGTWVEVKGSDEQVTDDDKAKLACTIDGGDNPLAKGLLLLGPIPDPGDGAFVYHHQLVHHKGIVIKCMRFRALYDGTVVLEEVTLGSFGLPGFDAWSSAPEFPREATFTGGVVEMSIGRGRWRMEEGVSSAYLAARSARFEYGETPEPPAKRPMPPKIPKAASGPRAAWEALRKRSDE